MDKMQTTKISLILRMMFVIACVLTAGAAIAADNPAGDPKAASEAVDAFFKFHFAHDMGFTQEAVQQRREWLSPGLLEDCKKYFAQPQDPDEVPEIDGDPFTDSQDYPQSYEVSKTEVTGESAKVPVTLQWNESEKRTITVDLKWISGKWKIDDIGYESGDSLRKMLQ